MLQTEPAPLPTVPPIQSKPEPSNQLRIWSVRALVGDIRQRTEAHYADIWVAGEVSNCRAAGSGHIYFTLKDGEAQLPVVLFRRQAQLLRLRPADGLAVLIRGRVSVYESRGQLQLIAETIELRGAGALQLAFDQLKRRLAEEGLFDATRKRPLPAFPHCVGVVTSTSGAVLRDIVTVVRRRHARLNLLVFPATMQGAGCAASVIAGLRWFNEHPGMVEMIVLARGGGSMEDLAGFNDEALARAIAASELPVVSAIGHETDFTIADFVADLRAPTPSAAAELITTAQHRIEERVQALSARLDRGIRFQAMHARQRYARLSADAVLSRLRDRFGSRAQRLDDLRYRVEAAMRQHVQSTRARWRLGDAKLQRQSPIARVALAHRRLASAMERLERSAARLTAARSSRLARATARLEALSPLAVLNRGYALLYTETNGSEKLLRSASETQPGSLVRARLARGTIEAQVLETRE